MSVAATVVDVSSATPTAGLPILVDSNVWYWLAYPRLSTLPWQSAVYSAFVTRAKRAGARLQLCELSIAELAHVVERERMQVREAEQQISYRNLKDFRNNPTERPATLQEMSQVFQQVYAMSEELAVTLDRSLGTAATKVLQGHPLDGVDAFLVEAANRAGTTAILTHDADFASVSGITMITANIRALNDAQQAGKRRATF